MACLLLIRLPMLSALILFGLTIISTVDAAVVTADACAPVDFSARFSAPRAQGDTDWCGAMVAADLLSYRLGFRVAAISVGSAYYGGRSAAEVKALDTLLGIPTTEYGGALMSSMLTLALRAKVCPESELSDDRLGLAKWDVFDAIRARRAGRSPGPTCGDPYDLSWLGWRVVGHDLWPRPDMTALHEQVSRRNPVAATVEMNQLFNLDKPADAGARWFGNHYVLVVGQRPIAGVCHLLIRNSWGDQPRWIAEGRFRAALKNIFYLD